MLDVGRAQTEFGFKAQTQFKQGLKNTVDWYIAQQMTLNVEHRTFNGNLEGLKKTIDWYVQTQLV